MSEPRPLPARVTVVSPNRIVSLELDAAGNLAVRVPRGALPGHTETAFAQEVGSTVMAALRLAHRTYAAQTDGFRRALADHHVYGVSERGYVTVARDSADSQLRVRFQRRTFRFLCEPEVAEEIRSALAAALASSPANAEFPSAYPAAEPPAASSSAASSPERTQAGMPTPS